MVRVHAIPLCQLYQDHKFSLNESNDIKKLNAMTLPSKRYTIIKLCSFYKFCSSFNRSQLTKIICCQQQTLTRNINFVKQNQLEQVYESQN